MTSLTETVQLRQPYSKYFKRSVTLQKYQKTQLWKAHDPYKTYQFSVKNPVNINLIAAMARNVMKREEHFVSLSWSRLYRPRTHE